MTKKIGRPPKYKESMLKEIKDLMEVGASKTEVCAKIDIHYDTLLDWMDKESERFNKEFSDSIKRGEQLSQAWWEKHGRTCLESKDFNSTLWYMNMKNRFRRSPEQWIDKQEVAHDHTIRSVKLITNVKDK